MLMTRIAIVDDHPLVLEGLESMLSGFKDIMIVGKLSVGEKLMPFLDEHKVEVILLDINLPDSNGLELCKLVVKHYPKISILGLSNFDETSFIRNMMRNGAKGYLLKNTSPKELYEAIITVNKGGTFLPEKVKSKLLNESFGVQSATFIPQLTRREEEILQCIANELTNSDIAEKLFISVKTVESHRKNLLQKFGVRNTAGLIKEAYVKGLLS